MTVLHLAKDPVRGSTVHATVGGDGAAPRAGGIIMADWSSSTPVGGITVSETPESTTAHLWGEVDDSLRQQAGAALARALDRNLPVVLDTSRVEFIDSAGIAFLVQLCTIGREEGLQVSLHDPPQVVSEVLEMLGLDELITGREAEDRVARG